MTMLFVAVTALLFAPIAHAAPGHVGSQLPTVTVKNGTYEGRYEPSYGTEHFLGMPYAQPPIDDLRFRVPQPLNGSWSDTRNATEFSYSCIGYGRDTWSQGNYVSEDCLTLNVIRSRGSGAGLPVLVWIHGGGLVQGGGADPRYNQSFIVQQAALAGQPIIAVSMNYRLSAWGFLYGQAFQDSGNTMLGFRDQRLALHWIQENIEAFGGDPSRVTIQGESAGARSVGAQLLAYGGRDDRLFSAAILESGAPVHVEAYPTVEDFEPVVANISAGVGCQNAPDVLQCLRTVPTDLLNSVINSTATSGIEFNREVIDGDFVKEAASGLAQGKFVKVPMIIGANADEGPSFGPRGINTTNELLSYITSLGYDNATAQDFSVLYPDIPAIGLPATFPGRPNATAQFGQQYKRSSSLVGDIRMHAPRRLMARSWAQHGVKVFSYHWNVLVNGISWTAGAVHFQEVAFVFFNTQGFGYPENGGPNPMGGPENEKYVRLAQLMVRQWISFVNFHDPNKNAAIDAELWPEYTLDNPQNFLFRENVTSHVEPDYYRAEGIEYMIELTKARAGTNCTGLVACSS